MKRFIPSWKDYIPIIAFAVLTAIYLYLARGYDEGSRLMPVAVAFVMFGLLVLDGLMQTKTRVGTTIARVLNPHRSSEEQFGYGRQLSAIMWPILFVLLLLLVGVAAAVPLYVFASMRFHGRWSYRWSLTVAAVTGAAVWLLFNLGLGIALYPGLLFSSV